MRKNKILMPVIRSFLAPYTVTELTSSPPTPSAVDPLV